MKRWLFILGVMSLFLVSSSGVFANEAVENREAQLRSELEQNLKEQQRINAQLTETKSAAGSIERDIAILTAEINKAKLIIREKNIIIEQLGKDIGIKNAAIGDLNERIDSGKVSLAQLVRKKNQIDDYSIVEAVLSSNSLSEFFTDVDSFDSINKSMNALFEDIRNARDLTESEREALSAKKEKETDAKQTILVEQRSIEKKEDEKKRLLSLNQKEQAAYATELKSRERRAAEIRTALFALRDTAAIPFGTALEYAEQAERDTGIRPAFLLAILTQETNLGENIGTCNRPGDPESKKWYNIMPGPDDNSWRDDHASYREITSNLGLEPSSMPLSCPWMNGWGGAMGPSQFIPTTWLSYVPRLHKILGEYPNPWNPEHAFMASSIYLTDLGADAQTYSAEQKAALKYYAGSNWWKEQNAFYGKQVMAKAANIQENMIDPLKGL